MRHEGWQVMFGAIGMTSILSYHMSAVPNVSPPNHSEISYRPQRLGICCFARFNVPDFVARNQQFNYQVKLYYIDDIYI